MAGNTVETGEDVREYILNTVETGEDILEYILMKWVPYSNDLDF
jgi:hypothetical protein